METKLKSVFGKPDRKNKSEEGSVCSEYPSWMMDGQIESLGEDMDTLERDIDSGFIPSEDIFGAKQALGDFKERFDDIVRSKPMYTPSQEQFLHSELEGMNSRMADTLYSRYDQLNGKGSIARPQQEADLNDKPCIKIHPAIAEMCNLQGVKNGMASRNQLDKARKILCHYFGRDDASREAIRPENNAGRSRPMVGYTNERFAKRHEEIFGKKENRVPRSDEETGSGKSFSEQASNIREKLTGLENQDNGEGNMKEAIFEESPGIDLTEADTAESQKEPEPKKRTPRKPAVRWQCGEKDCGYIGTNRTKGIHMAGHARRTKEKE